MTNFPSVTPVALITGSGRRRVGSVIAAMLAEAGYQIALHYHQSADSAQQLLSELRKHGVACAAFQADVSEEDQVAALVEGVMDHFGRVDALVTTASIWEAQSLEEVTAEDMLRSYRVNTLGTFLCCRAVGLRMAQQDEGGAIVTVGDWAVQRPYLHHAAYFTSKGAIESLTRALAVELAHRNPRVRVNCIHPGPVMFPPDTSEEEKQDLLDSTLVKQGDCPQSIGNAVKFLIQEPFVTGTSLCVDGGRSIYAQETTSRKRPI